MGFFCWGGMMQLEKSLFCVVYAFLFAILVCFFLAEKCRNCLGASVSGLLTLPTS